MKNVIDNNLQNFMKNEEYNYVFRNDFAAGGNEEIQNLKNIVQKLIIITSAEDNYEAMERIVSYKKECSLISDEWNKKIRNLSEKYFNPQNNIDDNRRVLKKRKGVNEESFDSKLNTIKENLIKKSNRNLHYEVKDISEDEIQKETINIRNQYITSFYSDFCLKTKLLTVTLQNEKPLQELMIIETMKKKSFLKKISDFFKKLPDATKEQIKIWKAQIETQSKRLIKNLNELYKATKNGNISKITDSLNSIFNSLKNECKDNAKILSDSIVNYLVFFTTELDKLETKFNQEGLSSLQLDRQRYMNLLDLLNNNEVC